MNLILVTMVVGKGGQDSSGTKGMCVLTALPLLL